MKKLRAFFSRFVSLFSRAHRERDLAAELEAHLALHVEDNLRAGMTPEEARRQALLKLGGIEQAKEDYRDGSGIPWLEHLLADFRYAFRMLRRSRSSALAIVVLLSLGIGGVTALFGPLYSLVLSPLQFPHSNRIVRIGGNVPIFAAYSPEFVHQATLRTIFSHVAAYQAPLATPSEPSITISPGAQPVSVRMTMVTPDFFATLGVKPEFGRDLSDEPRTAPVVVVSNRFWRSELHGTKDIIGRSLAFADEARPIIGVMPPGFDFPPGTDMWAPMLGSGGLEMLGRLRPGISMDQAAAELKGMGPSRSPVSFGDLANPGPIVETLHDYLLGDRKPLLWTLWGLSLLFLLLACAGAANLLLARGVQRQSEMVVRITLGAGRTRLIRQLLAETLLLAVAGTLLGLGIAAAAGRWILLSLPALHGAPSLSLASFGLAVVLAVVATVLCGLAPAFHATGGDLNAFLKTGTSGITHSTPRHRLFGSHELLSGGQLVVAMMLLVSTGLLLRSLAAHLRVPLGFEPRNVAVVGPIMLPVLPALGEAQTDYLRKNHLKPAQMTRGQLDKFFQAIRPERDAERAHYQEFQSDALQRLANLPGVVSAGAMLPIPFTKMAENDVLYRPAVPKTWTPVLPAPGVQWVAALRVEASPNSFRLLGIHLLAGRGFTAADVAQETQSDKVMGPMRHLQTGVAIVNEPFAQAFWPNENPIGKTFFPRGIDSTVVGVAANVREYTKGLKPVPTYYVPFDGTFSGLPLSLAEFIVKLQPGASISQFARSADHALAALQPGITHPEVRNLQEMTTASLADLRLTLFLLGCFSVLGTIVAALGVYAAATLMAAARTREMGIRIALGAHAEQIRGLAVWRSLRLILVALPLGALCAWGLARSLSHWLFQVGAADPATYAVSVALLALIALAAGLVPARRAARVDPVVALREE